MKVAIIGAGACGLVLAKILENNNIEDGFKYDFSTTFAINTLLNWGVLEEKE